MPGTSTFDIFPGQVEMFQTKSQFVENPNCKNRQPNLEKQLN